MKIVSYVLNTIVVLATSAPTLALAQYENAGQDRAYTMMIMTIFSLTLYITISAVLGVIGYSVWRVYKGRRKTIKQLV